MFFSSKRKLIRAVDSLAIYNDKGIAWSRHTPEQSEAQRRERMQKIESLISKVGEGYLPLEFLKAVRSGVLATDDTGLYVDKLKEYFRQHS
jgi:hypothetical protein